MHAVLTLLSQNWHTTLKTLKTSLSLVFDSASVVVVCLEETHFSRQSFMCLESCASHSRSSKILLVDTDSIAENRYH